MKRTFTQLQMVAAIVFSCCQITSAQEPPAPTPAVQPPIMKVAPSVVSDIPLAMNGRPDVFYNYYLPPAMDGTSASMYPAPLPVPARVGHTAYTYQALLPHEHMYRHSRVYYTPHATRDMFYADPCTEKSRGQNYTKTSVIWTYGSNHLSPLPFQLPNIGRAMKKACGATCR